MEKEVDSMLAAYLRENPVVEQEAVIEEENTEIQETASEVVEQTPTEEIQEVAAQVEEKAEVVAPFVPEFKSEKDRWLYETIREGKEKEAYEALRQKFEYESYSSDQKVLAYLKELNPMLDEDDIAFKAASEFGIGAEEYVAELLTEDQKKELKSQEIKRKELLYKADGFFKEKAESFELPSLPNPLDTDEGYKSYKEFQATQAELAEQEVQFKKEQQEMFNQIDSASLKIETIEIEPKIVLDDSEFTFKSEFKLDENKRKQLADFAKVYTPTQEEVKEYFPEDGKFNIPGYLSHLAEIKFSKQIRDAVVKEGIAKAREEFIEKDLKNSTLRNNQSTQQTNREVAPEVSLMRY
jgi:hypothetical protein